MTISAWLNFYKLKTRNFVYFEIHPVHRWNLFLNHIRNMFIKKRLSIFTVSTKIKRVFVISLSYRQDRRKVISEQLRELDICFEFVDGVHLTNPVEVKEYFSGRSIKNLSHGSLSCATSHIMLWRNIAEMETGLYLVFEDDVTFENNFIKQLTILEEQYPADVDIFYLGSRNNRLRDILYFTDYGYVRSYNPRMGAFAYCITPGAAKKILELVLPVDLLCGGIDTALGILTRDKKLIAYQFEIPQVFHRSITTSNIFNPSVPRKPLHESSITKWPWK